MVGRPAAPPPLTLFPSTYMPPVRAQLHLSPAQPVLVLFSIAARSLLAGPVDRRLGSRRPYVISGIGGDKAAYRGAVRGGPP